MGDQNIIDKSMRSVFVGNIPYEATEEKLKDIFNEVGPVVSFKLVYDRETGKPKGYGFCEYKDQETALSAMRNLNGYEIGGRSLRVDNACTEKSRLEMQSLMAGPPVDNTYGDAVESDKAPEAISKAVASLPPEQMFELMKQMKVCIQNNPSEGRAMLLQNPQLAYALLQAQVVMRIVDPQTAITMLHKSNPPAAPLMMATDAPRGSSNVSRNDTDWVPSQRNSSINQNQSSFMDIDLRSMDPRAPRNVPPSVQDQDLRIPPMVAPPVQQAPFAPVDHGPRDPRYARDPRAVATNPSRAVPPVAQPPRPVAQPTIAPQPPVQPSAPITAGGGLAGAIPTGASDQEKAALIMQVLQLSDEQIAMLPPEQRQSILVLKEQIAKSTQR